MRRLTTIIGLELYAFALAWMQALGGVRTDEAKYLLNIPYPHPPLARWILSQTEALPFQEMFWRIVFATLVVQAAWLVWTMAPDLPRRTRLAMCGCWLIAAAVVLQAGSIMMAPLNALQGLLFVWLYLRRDIDLSRSLGWLCLLWLASLFTAYQAVLFLPVVIAVVYRTRTSWFPRAACILVPLILLVLYTLSNPLSLASFVNAGGENAGLSLLQKASLLLSDWVIAGSCVLLVTGIAGMVLHRSWALLAAFVLLSAFVFVSFREYYAVLFTPLLIGGTVLRSREKPNGAFPVFVLTLLATILLAYVHQPARDPGPARETVRAIAAHAAAEGEILLHGSFGHEWQYESDSPIAKFSPSAMLLARAKAVVCLSACPNWPAGGWVKLENAPVETWVRVP